MSSATFLFAEIVFRCRKTIFYIIQASKKDKHSTHQKQNASDTLFFRKLPAIMETGFSTWASHIANEDDQLRWVQESLPAVREIIHRDGPIHYFCFYELTQGPPKKKVEFPPEECCFGITYANFTKKKAFNALSEQLLLMNKQV